MALKANLIQNTNNDEPTLAPINELGIPNVDAAVESWEAYIELCNRLLDDTDFQEYHDKDGELRKFPKKSAWFKLGRAFNVRTEIIEKTVERGKNGQVKEAYYRVRASLPNNQRSVEADASCDIWEKGKSKSTGHDLRTTAETRATNRAIAKLIGAGEVSDEELNNTNDLTKVNKGIKR